MKDRWETIVVVAIVCALGGYFAGREHLKYELSQEVQRAATGNALDFLKLTPEQCNRLVPGAQLLLSTGLDPKNAKLSQDILRDCAAAR